MRKKVLPIPLVEPSERETIRKMKHRINLLVDVKECKEVRMSFTRKKPNVYVHVWLEGNPDYEETHRICSDIEDTVRTVIPNARVSIRSEPSGGVEPKDIWSFVKRIAEDEPGSRGAHNIHFQNLGGKLGVDLHLEVGAGMKVKQAHEVSARIEKKLKEANLGISEVIIHAESVSDLVSSEHSGHGTEIRSYVEHIVKNFPDVSLARPPIIRQFGKRFHIILKPMFKPGMKMDRVSEITSRLEAAIKDGHPLVSRVDMTVESAQ